MTERDYNKMDGDNKQNVWITVLIVSVIFGIVFLIYTGSGRAQTLRQIDDQKVREHELRMAQLGYHYIEKGSWVKP